ncbi:hypothetical protein ACT3R7_11815 [Halomonas sp. AOP43-A1-21]
MIKPIRLYAYAIAVAAQGQPVSAMITVAMHWLMFTVFEVAIEKLIWGESFQHWLDPIFNACFIGFAGMVVWQCAVFQTVRVEGYGDE